MRNQVVKKLGAFVMAATFAVGMLVTSVQPSDAATTNFQVKKVSYSKEYKMDDGSVYFSMKGKFPTITDDSKAARKINQVLEKEKNRLIHQYDKELADFKKEYKSQAAYDKENGYASIRCADAGKDRSGCYEGSGESRTCADYRNLKLMLLP